MNREHTNPLTLGESLLQKAFGNNSLFYETAVFRPTAISRIILYCSVGLLGGGTIEDVIDGFDERINLIRFLNKGIEGISGKLSNGFFFRVSTREDHRHIPSNPLYF